MTDQTLWELVSPRLPNLKRGNGANEWVSNSPFHAGSDSMGFHVNVEPHGKWGKFKNHAPHAGELPSGSLHDLAEALGIDIAPYKAVSTKRKYMSMADYAAAHYVSEEWLTGHGWREGKHKGRPCLIWMVGKWERYRFLDGNEPPFLWETVYEHGKRVDGGSPAWYGLPEAIAIAERLGLDKIVLVNGEPSTETAQYHDIPACCFAGGEGNFSEVAAKELATHLKDHPTIKKVLVAFDADPTGKQATIKAVGLLRLQGFITAFTDLQMGAQQDVADVCGLYGKDALKTLLEWIVKDEAKTVEQVAAAPDLSKLMGDLKKMSRRELEESAVYEQMRVLVAANDRQQAQGKIVPFSQAASSGRAKAKAAAANPQESIGFNLGIPAFDAINGGFKPFFYGFVGATNMGKTQWMTTVAAALLRQSPGLIVPTESSVEDWMRRLVAADTGVSAERIELGKLSKDEQAKVDASYARYGSMDVAFLADISPTAEVVRAAFEEGHKEFGWEWVLVDSATNMSASTDDTFQKAAAIVSGLLGIYEEFDVPVIASFQSNREVNGRSKKSLEPRLGDIFGGGKNEQLLNVVWGIYDHDYYVQQGMAQEDLTKYPEGTVSIIALKLKRTPPNNQRRCFVRRIPGANFAPVEVRRISVNTRELAGMSAKEYARQQKEELLDMATEP